MVYTECTTNTKPGITGGRTFVEKRKYLTETYCGGEVVDKIIIVVVVVAAAAATIDFGGWTTRYRENLTGVSERANVRTERLYLHTLPTLTHWARPRADVTAHRTGHWRRRRRRPGGRPSTRLRPTAVRACERPSESAQLFRLYRAYGSVSLAAYNIMRTYTHFFRYFFYPFISLYIFVITIKPIL